MTNGPSPVSGGGPHHSGPPSRAYRLDHARNRAGDRATRRWLALQADHRADGPPVPPGAHKRHDRLAELYTEAARLHLDLIAAAGPYRPRRRPGHWHLGEL